MLRAEKADRLRSAFSFFCREPELSGLSREHSMFRQNLTYDFSADTACWFAYMPVGLPTSQAQAPLADNSRVPVSHEDKLMNRSG